MFGSIGDMHLCTVNGEDIPKLKPCKSTCRPNSKVGEEGEYAMGACLTVYSHAPERG